MQPNTSTRSVDVTFALTGDPKINSRALRQLNLLSDLGVRILVLGLGHAPSISDLNIRNVTLQYLPRPAGEGVGLFQEIHQQFQLALHDVVSSVYHASDLYALPAMHRIAKQQQAKLVFDSRELYTHLPATVGRPWVKITWSILLYLYARRADCVYTVSESIAQHLRKYFRLNTVHVMRNVPGPHSITSSNYLRKQLNLTPDTKIILHQGNMQEHRGIFTMIKAMFSVENAVLVFMGDGPSKAGAEKAVWAMNLGHKIRFIDPVPPDQLLSVTASADIGLTLLEDCCLNHRYALPNKLFEYLAAGVPVIASDLPEITQIIEKFDVGCVVPSGDDEALESTLNYALRDEELRQTWASNTSHVQEFFNFETESKRFITPYRSLLGK